MPRPAVCFGPPLAVNRASVSQHGPLILGFNDVLTNVAMVAGAAVALQQQLQGNTDILGFLGVAVVSAQIGTHQRTVCNGFCIGLGSCVTI